MNELRIATAINLVHEQCRLRDKDASQMYISTSGNIILLMIDNTVTGTFILSDKSVIIHYESMENGKSDTHTKIMKMFGVPEDHIAALFCDDQIITSYLCLYKTVYANTKKGIFTFISDKITLQIMQKVLQICPNIRVVHRSFFVLSELETDSGVVCASPCIVRNRSRYNFLFGDLSG
jgi:hypothetical protein